MASQIAATPVVKGEMAKKIWQEANTKRSEAAKRGEQKIAEKFRGIFKDE